MSRYRFYGALGLLMAWFSAPCYADIIYVCDDSGRVGRWNTTTNSGAFVGNLAGHQVGQALGLTYDAASNSVIVLDRNANNAYSMNAVTGAITSFFGTTGGFQGGALVGGILYGIEENSQKLASYTYPGGTYSPPPGSTLTNHTHALGESNTGVMYTTDGNSIRVMNTNGSLGATIVTTSTNFIDDLDRFNGNFLATNYGFSLDLINGVTGASSVFLNSTQLGSMGLSQFVTGVTVVDQLNEVPVPSGIVLGSMGIAGVAGVSWLRRRKSIQAA